MVVGGTTHTRTGNRGTLLKRRAKQEAALGAPQYRAWQLGLGQSRPERSGLPVLPSALVQVLYTPGKSASSCRRRGYLVDV